jgi:hypothetical protein
VFINTDNPFYDYFVNTKPPNIWDVLTSSTNLAIYLLDPRSYFLHSPNWIVISYSWCLFIHRYTQKQLPWLLKPRSPEKSVLRCLQWGISHCVTYCVLCDNSRLYIAFVVFLRRLSINNPSKCCTHSVKLILENLYLLLPIEFILDWLIYLSYYM